MYVPLLAISGTLYLSVFEQPANRAFFSTLLGGPNLRSCNNAAEDGEEGRSVTESAARSAVLISREWINQIGRHNVERINDLQTDFAVLGLLVLPDQS
jgi:hypothetical protein